MAALAGEPAIASVLAQLKADEIRVVPFFMEDGYFTRVAIPHALGGDRRVRLCLPVGTHQAMPRLIANLARRALQRAALAPKDAALLLVGHGSASAPGRRLALHEHAEALARESLFARVEPACLEEPPFLPDALAALRSWPVMVAGFFAGQGLHPRDDVPQAIADEQSARGGAGHSVIFCGSVGDEPGMAAVIRDRAGA